MKLLSDFCALSSTTNLFHSAHRLLMIFSPSLLPWLKMRLHFLLVSMIPPDSSFSPRHHSRYRLSHIIFTDNVFHTGISKQCYIQEKLEYERWTGACCKPRAGWGCFNILNICSVFAESAESADLYITRSGSQEYVGIHKFGENRVAPAGRDKGICICICKRERVIWLLGSALV